MTFDVSLCVVRVERSVDGPKTNEVKHRGELKENCASSVPIIRGRREIRNISIETYVLQQPDDNVLAAPQSIFSEKKMLGASASGGAPAGTLCGTSAEASGGTSDEASGGTSDEASGGTSAGASGGTSAGASGGTSDEASGGTLGEASGGALGRTAGGTSNGTSSGASNDVLMKTLNFMSGNPFVETTCGIIHLFKEDELTSIDRAARRSQTVCILAVPSTMTCSDLLTFVAACHSDIKHVRIIKDSSPNQYMALITFRSPCSVEEFYRSFNGIPFNNLEPEWCCHLVFVSRIEAVGENEGGSIAPASHTELPICPVCLERMDESVDGILTILCNHAFHGSCLVKWGDTSCPVCRYVQTPEPSAGNHCLECKATDSLWICLICGHVGCGRYLHGHAYQHYRDTHHCYSMQLGTNSVWDYVGDNFVHRILQNKTDGKLVEGPNPEKPVDLNAKVEAIQLEYTNLLTSQLESQRTYYENIISGLEGTVNELTLWKEKAENKEKEISKLNENLTSVTTEKNITEKKVQNLMNKLSQSQKSLAEEKELNVSMQMNQAFWKEKFVGLEKEFNEFRSLKDKEVAELKDQMRDVMFYLEAGNVISQNPNKEEIRDGKIIVGKPECSTSEPKKSHQRRHKRN